MRKVFKKLFSSSGSDGVGEKSARKLPSSRPRISMSSIISQVKLPKFNSPQTNYISSPTTTPPEVGGNENIASCSDRQRNYRSEVSLHAAVSDGNLKLVEKLLARGADAEIVDDNGLTPFLKAVEMGNVELVNLLVRGNKFQTNSDGNTALHLAVKQEFLRVAEVLVSHDPLVNVPNKAGDLPLHIAVSKGCISIVELLLKNNAVIDVQDSQKRTPLFIAVKLENVPLIQLLLKYGAYQNDNSIFDCLSSCRNFKIKALFRSFDYKEKMSVIHDDDSLNSEQSCILPPPLSSPRSWNVLHPKQKDKCSNAGENVSSQSPYSCKNFTKEQDKKIKTPSGNHLNRSVELTKCNQIEDDEKSVIEDCKKALNRLSLQVSQKENPNTHGKPNDSTKSVKISSLCSSAELNSHLTEDTKFMENSENNLDLKIRSFLVNKISNEDSSSSDEEPLIWENSNDGGYFTEWSRSSKLSDTNEAENRCKSSSSDEESDSFRHRKVYSVMLNSLKRITQDNKDLETETAVLRESVEKLKYDLANSREEVDTEKINSSSLMSHLARFDTKYIKDVENTGISQVYITNLEKEISHLKRTYNESCKINRFLVKELRKSLADITQMKSVECPACEDKCIQINELQAEIVVWKNKYDDYVQSYEEKNSLNPQNQDFFDLHSEICHEYDKMKECLFQAGISRMHDPQQLIIDEESQAIMNETERKIHQYLTKVLNAVERKAEKYVLESKIDRTEELVKQKLLLEVSKLNSIIKDKEIKEERLNCQVRKLREEIQKSKSEKRNMLIRKTFRDQIHTDVNKRNLKDSMMNLDTN